MISLENAEKITALIPERQWELGDIFWDVEDEYLRLINEADLEDLDWLELKNYTWLPTLSQLLEEVGKRGYGFELFSMHLLKSYRIESYSCHVSNQITTFNKNAETKEDAVALALIEILKGEK